MRQIRLLERVIQQDLGGQCVGSWSRNGGGVTVQGKKGVKMAENDGPMGAAAIFRALRALGKEIVVVTDDLCLPCMKAAFEGLDTQFTLFPRQSNYATPEQARKEEEAVISKLVKDPVTQCDVLLAIERLGSAPDGKYYNMRGRDLSHETAKIDKLFIAAADTEGVSTVGIGDGGNEIGMGSVLDKVRANIPLGEKIGTRVKCDSLITAGVSNWGGYALSAALYVLHKEQTKNELPGLVPSYALESALLDKLVAMGCVDGTTQKPERKVDGMNFDVEHKRVLLEMEKICNSIS